MKMPQPVQPVTPISVLNYWFNFQQCKFCHRAIRDEMHLYNHFRKYHWQPSYFYWNKYIQQWVRISETIYLTYRHYKLHPVARTK